MKMEVRIPFCNDIGTTESEREVRFPFSDTLTGNCWLKNESLKFRFPMQRETEKENGSSYSVQSNIVGKRVSARVHVFHSLDYSANGSTNTAVSFFPSGFGENIKVQSSSCVPFLRNWNLWKIRTVQLSHFLLLLNPGSIPASFHMQKEKTERRRRRRGSRERKDNKKN